MQERLSRVFHKPSSFLRTALLVYIFLIVYGSLYPLSGWRLPGGNHFSFLFESFPRYWTGFDIFINIAAYVPLGFLLLTAVSPLLRGVRAFLFALLAGIALSLTMESLQVFLPGRVPSNIDLLTNATGTFIGTTAGAAVAPFLFRDDRIHYLVRNWLHFGSSRVLIVPMLWPLAQIYPQNYLFGHGQVLPHFSQWLSAILMMPVSLSIMLNRNLQLSAEQYWLSETIITSTGMAGAILLLLCLLGQDAPRVILAFSLFAASIVTKSLAMALLFEPKNAFVWVTPGAVGGILTGVLLVFGLIFVPPAIQRRMAAAMLLISLITVNILPDNQYFLSTLQTWSQGKFLNFNGAAYFLASVWPYLALWFLFHIGRVSKKTDFGIL